ncbi:MAG: hypothetical protein PWP76_207 [Candidatus Diapherotrites archaeon]|nr:hypothetical protein [Candidatus Diapherotrites archaeon]MDN5366868.1 hypothetical protein [Candidatus Diapherotrites archaeon]
MYYQERRVDPDLIILLVAAAVLAFAVMYTPYRADILSEGFTHVLILDATVSGEGVSILLYSPADARFDADMNFVSVIPAGESIIHIPKPVERINACVESNNFRDCGTISPRGY